MPAPDLVVHDHRVLGWDAPRAVGLLMRARLSTWRRCVCIDIEWRGGAYVPVWLGTQRRRLDPSVIVAELDDRGDPASTSTTSTTCEARPLRGDRRPPIA